MEGREKTKEELDEEKSIFYAQEKLIEENKQDLNFLHKKAEDIFYNESYSEWRWDSLFRLVTMYIEDHHNPASLPVLLRLCDDDRFWASNFQEGWLNVFAFGFKTEDMCREYFTHLHEIFPQAPVMGAELYTYCIESQDLECEKKYVLLAKPEAFRALVDFFERDGELIFSSNDDKFSTLEKLRKLKQYYDAHRLQVV